MGDRSPDTLQTLGNRLLRLDSQLNATQRKQVNKPIHTALEQMGESTAQADLRLVARQLIHAANPDRLAEVLQAEHGTDEVSDAVRTAVYNSLVESVVKPFHHPDVRDAIEALRRDTDQLIDDSADELLDAGYDEEKAQGLIKRYEDFIAAHQDELDAIELIYSKPYSQRQLSYDTIETLAEAIAQPPYNIAPLEVWKAYEQLEKNRVKGVPPKELLTNIVSLIRFSTGLSEVLEPFPALVEQRFAAWLEQQGAEFSTDQLAWLGLIKEQIAHNAEFEMDDFDLIPGCKEQGGLLKAQALFGAELPGIVRELNGYLIA